ncbi:unnamed protein product [Protopolystoma xenopodis]|uniref:OCRE domain-containing protein n=1 Tax=Protopolystoma xenopodis TaxID=117903 RepID=A0A3S5AN75_9PLAT|nr:unnamed protein product [Protopolystoma xenopodis]
MEFDVFDKLSELETKVQYLRSEIESKNSRISDLEKENKELRRSILNGDISSNLSIKDVSSQEAPPGTLIDLESKSDLLDLASGISSYDYGYENQLFYEPRTGVYYSYNSETREYSYHSRVNQEVLKQKYEEIASDPAVQHAVKTGTNILPEVEVAPDPHREVIEGVILLGTPGVIKIRVTKNGDLIDLGPGLHLVPSHSVVGDSLKVASSFTFFGGELRKPKALLLPLG